MPRRNRIFALAIFYAWLLMNADTSNRRIAVQSLRLLSRAFHRQTATDILAGRGGRSFTGAGGGGSLSTIEAIALIQAINNGNRNANSYPYGDSGGSLRQQQRSGGGLRQLMDAATSGNQISNRQLPVPVPVPTPFPAAIVAAFVAAFAAAIAAGFPPLIAIVKAIAAAAALLVAVIIINFSAKNKGNALVKKIVIKKTIFPFIFPITVKKKEEKVYKYKHKPEHHHHEEVEHYEIKHKKKHKKHKYQKVDVDDVEEMPLAPLPTIPTITDRPQHLKTIESLLDEQDTLQSVSDAVLTSSDKQESKQDLTELQ